MRAPLGESLSPPRLSARLPFPKEKKRRTRSGEEEEGRRRHYREAATNSTLAHAIRSRIGGGIKGTKTRRRFATKVVALSRLCVRPCVRVCCLVSVCVCVRTPAPALCGHNNGQNNYWKKQRGEARGRRLSRFQRGPSLPGREFLPILARTPSDWFPRFGDIYFHHLSHVSLQNAHGSSGGADRESRHGQRIFKPSRPVARVVVSFVVLYLIGTGRREIGSVAVLRLFFPFRMPLHIRRRRLRQALA